MRKEVDERLKKWIKETVIPEAFNSNQQKIKNVDFECSTEMGTDHFTSHNYFVQVTLQTGQVIKCVVKCSSQNAQFRQIMNSDDQFYNETAMYNTVLPKFDEFLNKSIRSFVYDLTPRCYYGKADLNKPEESVLVLEDLKEKEFIPPESLTFLDLEHCLLAMKKIAQFHAVSYAMKIKDKATLETLSQTFKEVRYQDGDDSKSYINNFNKPMSFYIIDKLLGQPEEIPSWYLNKLKTKLEDCYCLLKSFVDRDDELAVVCHGDYCRNNMLFKYHDGKPIDLKLIDFQTYRYANPGNDLSFFMYMNTTQELRRSHFEQLLKTYHSTLVKTISNITTLPEQQVDQMYTYDMILSSYGKISLHGYMISAFFLPVMMDPKSLAPAGDFEEEFVKNHGCFSNLETMFDRMTEESDEKVKDIIRHLYEMKFYVD